MAFAAARLFIAALAFEVLLPLPLPGLGAAFPTSPAPRFFIAALGGDDVMAFAAPRLFIAALAFGELRADCDNGTAEPLPDEDPDEDDDDAEERGREVPSTAAMAISSFFDSLACLGGIIFFTCMRLTILGMLNSSVGRFSGLSILMMLLRTNV